MYKCPKCQHLLLTEYCYGCDEMAVVVKDDHSYGEDMPDILKQMFGGDE